MARLAAPAGTTRSSARVVALGSADCRRVLARGIVTSERPTAARGRPHERTSPIGAA
jgi:hypothetical protein